MAGVKKAPAGGAVLLGEGVAPAGAFSGVGGGRGCYRPEACGW